MSDDFITAKEYEKVEGIKAANSGSAEDQFIQECISLYRDWLEIHKERGDPMPPKNQCILFIFAEAPEVDMGLANDLGDTQKIRRRSGTLEQGIVVCNQNFQIMLKAKSKITLNIEEAYDFIESELTDDATFAIALMGQQKLQIHRGGEIVSQWLNDPAEVPIRIDDVNVTPELIEKDMAGLHQTHFSTPLAIGARNMWICPDGEVEHRLGPLPEQHIQSFILSHFKGIYHRTAVVVNEEIKNQGGRVDICIERKPAGQTRKINTLLELKVLAPTKTFAQNADWAKNGIDQADKYKNQDTDKSFACIFDARRNKEEMPELQPHANEKKVQLKMYEMEVPADKIEKDTDKESRTKKGKKDTKVAAKVASKSKAKSVSKAA